FPNQVDVNCPTGCCSSGCGTSSPVCAAPGESPVPMDLAFSDLNGIGLTILRMKINAMMESSAGVWNDQDPAQAWIMQQAVARGPVKLMASVWSPPPWMKSNSSTLGGTCSDNAQHACITNTDCGTNPDGPPYCVSGTLAAGADDAFAGFLVHAATQFAA